MVREKVIGHILRTLRHQKPIVVRNSLFTDGRKEALRSRTKGYFHWYSCGPTVYDDAHLGHARAYVSFDIIRRVISSLTGTTVNYALGVTDIDDKILARSTDRGLSPKDLAHTFEARFFEDMQSLNVLPPSSVLRVTEHIQELQQLIADLVKSGAAYVTESGSVYFSVSSSGHRYAQLDPSRNSCQIGEHHQTNSDSRREKTDSRDFALWKRSDGHEQYWPSPWGNGRPGWHIECSAMAMATVGKYLDMHTGGIDLRFPHHTNELATAEACMGIQTMPLAPDREDPRWSHTWLHAGHLHLSGRKMSKSVKNFITVREFFSNGGTTDGFRVFCLLHKYSSPVEYTDERLADAHSYLSRIRGFLARKASLRAFWQNGSKSESHLKSMHPSCHAATELRLEVQRAEDAIEEALADDFDTARALSCIAQLIRKSNASLTSEGLPKSGAVALAYDAAGRVVEQTLDILGITQNSLSIESRNEAKADAVNHVEQLTDLLVFFRAAVRDAARRKDMGSVFDLCDSTREELRKTFQVRIADRTDGTSSWVKE